MVPSARGELVIRVSLASGILQTVAVCLRFLARWKSRAKFGADDWVILATLVPSYGMLVAGLFLVHLGGGGRFEPTLSTSEKVMFRKTIDSTLITYTLTMAMAKISILLLYCRIFCTPAFRKAAWLVGALCVSWALVCNLSMAFLCKPVTAIFNLDELNSAKCVNITAYYQAMAAINVALDIIVLCLPLYMVWHLKLKAKQKLILSGMFALGALTCVASIMRIITADMAKPEELPYTVIVPYIWSQLEALMAVICACLTTLGPLFHDVHLNYFPNKWGCWSRKSSSNRSSSSSRPLTMRPGVLNDGASMRLPLLPSRWHLRINKKSKLAEDSLLPFVHINPSSVQGSSNSVITAIPQAGWAFDTDLEKALPGEAKRGGM